tara:strand:+ start:212 stop:553 length:342 start_codon:yes stop_codon:yes gene_type:complete
MVAIFKTLDGLLEAVSSLPSTIKGLKVQRNLCSFQAPSEHLDMSKDLVEQTRTVINKAISDEFYSDYEVVDFSLKNYCGDHCPDTDSYYIMIETKESERLGKQLFNGELGNLD